MKVSVVKEPDADVFDAVSEKRCYRDAMPLDKCFDIIFEGSGQDFEPMLVEVFLDIRDEVEKVHNDAVKGVKCYGENSRSNTKRKNKRIGG